MWLAAGDWFGAWYGALEPVESTSDGLGYVDRYRVPHFAAGDCLHLGWPGAPIHAEAVRLLHASVGQLIAMTNGSRVEYAAGEVAAVTVRHTAGYSSGNRVGYVE
ncbi:MAG: hypothetical protein RJA36_1358 [Pseudomonadota bacterium]|jgi:hypothetical protein